jgi:predicted metalloprotease with PDZ domain
MEQVATATRADAATAATTYAAQSYHDLVDMPFFVGHFDIDSVSVALPGAQGARWVRLATYPAGSVSGARRTAALRWLERVIPPEAAVFGETPWKSYTVMQIADSSYGGASGLEHQSSHVDVLTPLALDSPILPSLYAHEIFHAWNVKRLRPADLVPYRYDAPQPTTLLWVSEGVTDYYADLAESRGGLVDSAGFLELVEGKIDEVAAAPPTALEDASLSTWIHPADGTQYLYYPKGSLVGLLLDVLIRDASDNRRSLDDVMRELYTTTYAKGTGFTNEQWWDAVGRAAGGRRFDDFYARYVDGREELPYATVLPLAGFRFVADTIQEPRLGVGTTADSTGTLVVTYLDPEGALAAAGVEPGDQLVSIGEVPVSDQSFGGRFRAKYARAAAGTPLPISVRRGERAVSLTAKLAFSPRVVRHVRMDARASAKAARIRNGILKGVTDQ